VSTTPLPTRLVAAVDVGATKTLVAVVPVTAGGEVAEPVARWRVRRLATDRDPDRHLAAVASVIGELAAGARVAAIGVAAPGPLDPARGVILHSPNLGWRDHLFGPALAALVGAPVGLEDDANAGALGEALLGAGAGRDPVVYLTLSTGVGAGVVVGGQIVRGAHDAAGEVGHLAVDPAGPRCGCGSRGHVEAFVGGAGLARRAAAAWPSGTLADGSAAPRDAAAILHLARAGDPTATRLANDATDALARAIAALSAVLDPGAIVVGGSLGLGQRALVRRAATRARRLVIAEAGASPLVVPAAHGERSPLVGAAILAALLAAPGVPAAAVPRRGRPE
jgi:glucokinase